MGIEAGRPKDTDGPRTGKNRSGFDRLPPVIRRWYGTSCFHFESGRTTRGEPLAASGRLAPNASGGTRPRADVRNRRRSGIQMAGSRSQSDAR